MNRFTIENKEKFCRHFLEPLLKLNPKCVLKLNSETIRAKSKYPDGSLYLEASSTIETDLKEEKELAFLDLSRFIKIMDFVPKDVVSFKIDNNFISYKDANNQFVLHIYDPKIVPSPRISFENMKKLDFEINMDLSTNIFFEILKASSIYPDLEKLYFNFSNNMLKIELSDRTKSNSDGFIKTMDNMQGLNTNIDFILSLNPLRSILSNKIEKINFLYHKASGMVNVLYEVDGIHMKYALPTLIK